MILFAFPISLTVFEIFRKKKVFQKSFSGARGRTLSKIEGVEERLLHALKSVCIRLANAL